MTIFRPKINSLIITNTDNMKRSINLRNTGWLFFCLSLILVQQAFAISSGQKKKIIIIEKTNDYFVEGYLKNIPDSIAIVLTEPVSKLLSVLNEDTVMNGRFSFSRANIVRPTKMLMYFPDIPGSIDMPLELWVAPGHVTKVFGESDTLSDWKIESSITEQLLDNKLREIVAKEHRKLSKLKMDEVNYKRLMDASASESFAYNRYEKKVDSLRIKGYLLSCKIAQKELSYLNTLPVDSVWLKKFLQYAEILGNDPKTLLGPTIKAVYSRLSDAERNTETGKRISEFINLPPIAQTGGEMVDCELYDSADSLRRLSEFKGKYILLDFWSATCNPCIQSLPELKALEKEYKDRLTVISINVDPKEVWLEALEKHKMSGEQWNDDRRDRKSIRAIYQVRAYPQYVLITPEGIIDQVWQGYAKASLIVRLRDGIK